MKYSSVLMLNIFGVISYTLTVIVNYLITNDDDKFFLAIASVLIKKCPQLKADLFTKPS
jgi:hypothetical protein